MPTTSYALFLLVNSAWQSSHLRFQTRDEAEAYATGMAAKHPQITAWRITPAVEAPNTLVMMDADSRRL